MTPKSLNLIENFGFNEQFRMDCNLLHLPDFHSFEATLPIQLQITNITVYKKLLIKSKVSNQILSSWCHYNE